MLDVLVNCRTAYIEDSMLVRDTDRISNHYVRA